MLYSAGLSGTDGPHSFYCQQQQRENDDENITWERSPSLAQNVESRYDIWATRVDQHRGQSDQAARRSGQEAEESWLGQQDKMGGVQSPESIRRSEQDAESSPGHQDRESSVQSPVTIRMIGPVKESWLGQQDNESGVQSPVTTRMKEQVKESWSEQEDGKSVNDGCPGVANDQREAEISAQVDKGQKVASDQTSCLAAAASPVGGCEQLAAATDPKPKLLVAATNPNGGCDQLTAATDFGVRSEQLTAAAGPGSESAPLAAEEEDDNDSCSSYITLSDSDTVVSLDDSDDEKTLGKIRK